MEGKAEAHKKLLKQVKKARDIKTKFVRYGSKQFKKLETGWRKPKGIDNKSRLGRKGYLPTPNAGYRTPKKIRKIHPSGFLEILVSKPSDLEKFNQNIHAIRIRHTVGLRKKHEILRTAKEKGLKVINPPKEKVVTEKSETEESSKPEGGSDN